MSDKIKASDFFDDNFSAEVKKKFEDFHVGIREISAEIKTLQVLQSKIAVNPLDNSSNINQHKKDVADSIKLENEIAAAKLKTAKIAHDAFVLEEKENKKAVKDLQDREKAQQKLNKENEKSKSVYEQLKKTHNDLSKAQMELTARNREGGIVFKAVSQQVKEYRETLDKAEQGVGRFHRNVGNYPNSLGGMRNAVNQLTREMPAFTYSIQTGLMGISNNIPILVDEMNRLKEANVGLAASGKPTESVFKSLMKSLFSWQTLMGVGITLMTVFGAKIVEWVAGLWNSNEALRKLSEENEKFLVTVRDGTKEIIKQTRIAILELLEMQGLITESYKTKTIEYIKYESEYIKVFREMKAKEKSISKDFDIENRKSFLKEFKEFYGEKNTATKERIKEEQDIIDLGNKEILKSNKDFQDQLNALAIKYNIDKLKIEEAGRKARGRVAKEEKKELLDLENEIIQARINQVKDEFDKESQQVSLNYKIALERLEENHLKGLLIEEQYIRLKKELKEVEKLKQIEIQENYYDKLDTLSANNNKDIFQKELELENIRYEKAQREVKDEEGKYAILEQLKIEHLKNMQSIEDNEKDRLIAHVKEVSKRSELMEEKTNTDKYLRSETIRKKARKKRLENLQDEIDEEAKILNDPSISTEEFTKIAQDKLNLEKQQSELRRQIREEEFKEMLDNLNTMLDFTEKALKRESDLKNKQLDNDLAMRGRNIQQQQALAIAGKDNILAFEKAAAAKDERQKQELAIKDANRAEGVAAIKLLASFAEKGEPSQALAKTVIVMAMERALFPRHYDGIEDTGNGSDIDSKGGFAAILHPHERVVNAKQNAMIGDMSNDELAKIARNYQNGYLPKYITETNTTSFAENATNSLLLQQFSTMNEEIKSIKQTLKTRPVSSINLNNIGEVIDTRIVNGLKKQTTKKSNSPLNYI